ncbi:MAG: translation elongation factor Ts [Planctomycetota bacterium]
MAVDAGAVKELREKTGLPMMECKKALEKTGGDVEKAIEELRKQGLKAQEKLAGRKATEGRVGAYVSPDGKLGVLVALRCETEPVSKNDAFRALLAEIVDAAAKERPPDRAALESLVLSSGRTVAETVTDLVNKIRENISVGRCAILEGDAVVQYLHANEKKAAMLALKGGSASDPAIVEAAREIGMHIVFAHEAPETTPLALSKADLDPEIAAKEREILLAAAKNDPKNAKKPEEILRKIVEGQVDKFVAGKCLLEQPFVKDPKHTVFQYLASHAKGAAIERFAYVATHLA